MVILQHDHLINPPRRHLLDGGDELLVLAHLGVQLEDDLDLSGGAGPARPGVLRVRVGDRHRLQLLFLLRGRILNNGGMG